MLCYCVWFLPSWRFRSILRKGSHDVVTSESSRGTSGPMFDASVKGFLCCCEESPVVLRYNSVCVWWDINLWIVFQVYNECVLVFLFNILLFPPTSEWFHPPPHRRSLWQHQRGHTSAEQRSCCGLHGTGECRLPSAGWEWYYSIETMRVSHFNMWYTGCITLKLDIWDTSLM